MIEKVEDIKARSQKLHGTVLHTYDKLKKVGDKIKEPCEPCDKIKEADKIKEKIKAVSEECNVVNPSIKEVDITVESLKNIVDTHSEHFAYSSEDISDIISGWIRLKNNLRLIWPENCEIKQENVDNINPTTVEDMTTWRNELEYSAALLTLPELLNKVLNKMYTGDKLDFHRYYKERLTDQENRINFLTWLSNQPRVLNGKVELDQNKKPTGQIISISPSLQQKIATVIILGLPIGIGLSVAWFLPSIVALLNLPLSSEVPNSNQSLGIYVLILIGAIAHLAVDGGKAKRAGDPLLSGASTRIEQALVWIHVSRSSFFVALLLVLAVFLGLIFLTDDLQFITGQLWAPIAAGFTLDSTAGLLVKRFSYNIESVDLEKQLTVKS